ncbi:MAG: BamA/TamA family outer membrane protein, partial [Candidatus Binatia bacterium]
AGVGAGTNFLLAEGRTRFFYPFYKSQTWGTFVASTGGRVGWGLGQEARSGEDIPLFERFFPGGINSVRGYEARSLGPREPVFDAFTGEIVDTSPVGGSIQLINNNEIIYPIVESIGLRGVLFFDLGNAWAHDQGFDLSDLQYAVGWGVRWLSPVGPLRLEIGYPLNKRPQDQSSVFQFAFGAPL